MNAPEETFTERRIRLAGQIARQRGEFSQAYTRLAQPLRYAEYGLRGFGFLRSNPWVFLAAPAAVSIIKTLWGGRAPQKKKPAPPAQPAATEPTGLKKTAVTWAGYAWRLFQFYRRIRPYFL